MPVFDVGSRVEACWNGVWYMGTVVVSKPSEWTVQCDVDELGCVVSTGLVRPFTGMAVANPDLNAKTFTMRQATCLAMFKPELGASAPTSLASPLSRASESAGRSRRMSERALSPGPARKPAAAQPQSRKMLDCKHSPGPARRPLATQTLQLCGAPTLLEQAGALGRSSSRKMLDCKHSPGPARRPVPTQTLEFCGAPTLVEHSGVKTTSPASWQLDQVDVVTDSRVPDPMLEQLGSIWSQMAYSGADTIIPDDWGGQLGSRPNIRSGTGSQTQCTTQSTTSVAQQGTSPGNQEAPEQATEICEPFLQPPVGQPAMQPAVPQQRTHGGSEASGQATDVFDPSLQPPEGQPSVQTKEVVEAAIQSEDRLFARWMFESSLARADRERMMEGVKRTLDFKGPVWMEDAARFGGRSMSVAGFNDGYTAPPGVSESREYGTCNLERNFREAMEALDVLHRPWSATGPPVKAPSSCPMTGWISWDAGETAALPDRGTGACSAGGDIEASPVRSPVAKTACGIEASPVRSPVAKTALEAVEMGLLELSAGSTAAEDAEFDQAAFHSWYNDSGVSSETLLPEADPDSRTERGDSGSSTETLMPGTGTDLHQAAVQDIQMNMGGFATCGMSFSVADSLAASSSTSKHAHLLESRLTTTPKVLEPEACLRSPPLDADSIAAEMVRDELQKLRLWYASLGEAQKRRQDPCEAAAPTFVRAAG